MIWSSNPSRIHLPYFENLLYTSAGVRHKPDQMKVVDEVIGRKPPIAPASVVSDGGWAY